MKITDSNGRIIDKSKGIYACIDEITDRLEQMTRAERIAWFKRNMYLEPLDFLNEIDGTLYAVRVFFREDAGENIVQKTERIILKKT